MEKNTKAEIDFDAWSEIARDNPETFEAMRLAAIEEVIESAPEGSRERLRRLQWRIDQERRLARTPMAACLRISRMMWHAVLGQGGLNERFTELQRAVSGQPAPALDEGLPPAGRIVAFARQRD